MISTALKFKCRKLWNENDLLAKRIEQQCNKNLTEILWNFRHHFKAIGKYNSLTDLAIRSECSVSEGISMFCKNKREKLACSLSHYTDSFHMTAAIKATGKIPFLYELGNQEIAIFMWCSREWKTNCLTKRKIYSVREAGRKLAAILSTCYIFDFSLFFARDIVTYWAMELDMAFSSPLSFIVYINQCLFVSRASSFHGRISHSCRPTLALPRGHSNTNKTPGSHLFCSRIWGQQVNLWFYWTKTRDNDELFCLFEVIRNPDLALENCGQKHAFVSVAWLFLTSSQNFDSGES